MSSEKKYKTILIFGAPGSGKGTQGKVLGNVPGFFHLACGDVFRALDPKSELGQTFLQYSSQGKLVPDNFTVRLWHEHIQKLVQGGVFRPDEEILVLDGIPRNSNQAKMMEQYIDVILMIYLETRDVEKMVARLHSRALKENRLDDANDEVIRRRFREYEAETAPVLEHYPAELIRNVDAGATPLEVLREVVGVILEANIQ